MPSRPLPRPAALACVAAIALTGCGGSSREDTLKKLPQSRADRLVRFAEDASSRTRSGDCDEAHDAVADGLREVERLPESVDDGLQANLQEWFTHIDGQIDADCAAEESPTPTETPTEEPTEEPTETPTESPTASPTEAPTEAPTSAPTTEPDPDNGGSEAPDGESGGNFKESQG